MLSPGRIRHSSRYHRPSTSSWLTSQTKFTDWRSVVSTSSNSFSIWMSLAGRKYPNYGLSYWKQTYSAHTYSLTSLGSNLDCPKRLQMRQIIPTKFFRFKAFFVHWINQTKRLWGDAFHTLWLLFNIYLQNGCQNPYSFYKTYLLHLKVQNRGAAIFDPVIMFRPWSCVDFDLDLT